MQLPIPEQVVVGLKLSMLRAAYSTGSVAVDNEPHSPAPVGNGTGFARYKDLHCSKDLCT